MAFVSKSTDPVKKTGYNGTNLTLTQWTTAARWRAANAFNGNPASLNVTLKPYYGAKMPSFYKEFAERLYGSWASALQRDPALKKTQSVKPSIAVVAKPKVTPPPPKPAQTSFSGATSKTTVVEEPASFINTGKGSKKTQAMTQKMKIIIGVLAASILTIAFMFLGKKKRR